MVTDNPNTDPAFTAPASAAPPSRAPGTPDLLTLTDIRKAFPAVVANDDVSLSIKSAEIHALLGENGAGKSTLVKMIYGVLQPDSGDMLWEGEPVHLTGPSDARKHGIGMVFQHFSLFEALTVAENIELALPSPGEGGPSRADLPDLIREVSRKYGLPLEPERVVHDLSVGERQRIEIVRCLLQEPKLLIMDEPTSVLTPQEAEQLFETLRRLSAEGCAILYISHKLQEIRDLCEVATVLRGGKVVAHCDPRTESTQSLARMMIGAAPKPPDREGAKSLGPVRFEIRNLSQPALSAFGVALKNIDLKLHGGEIVGVAGVAGNGQNELMAALIGEVRGDRADAILIDDRPFGRIGPRRRRVAGACFVPEERMGHATAPDMSLAENSLLSASRRMKLARSGWIDGAKRDGFTAEVIEQFNVKTRGTAAEARSLSGGNLQKFAVGREIAQKPSILIVNQPTWGVDAGSAAAIQQALLALAADGAAVLAISQDLDELFAISDRIAVMADGRLSEAVETAKLTVEEIGLMMGGHLEQAEAARA